MPNLKIDAELNPTAQVEVAEPNGRLMLFGRTAAYAFVQSHNNQPPALNPPGNRVGIGTDAPVATLDVDGSVRVADGVILAVAGCAEEFEIAPASDTAPGTVVVLGAGQPLERSSRPDDLLTTSATRATGCARPTRRGRSARSSARRSSASARAWVRSPCWSPCSDRRAFIRR